MSGRQSLLAEIEAKRRAAAKKDDVEVLAADLSIAPDESSYDPYDKPGHAKPLDVDSEVAFRRKALKKKRG
ncbi:MAG: hypothetical protein P8X81_10080 [Woeseiaceae bacterium]|jgi:hypothetical protein